MKIRMLLKNNNNKNNKNKCNNERYIKCNNKSNYSS